MQLRRFPLLLAALVTLLAPVVARAADAALEARVRRAAEATYIHGMTDDIARSEVSAAGIPVLLQLLFEPDLPRRDNVVAFLAHLDGEGITPRLLAFLDEAPGPLTNPNEERALLLVPLALARRTARGDAQARAALERLLAPGLSAAQRPGPSSLAPLLRSQAELALARAADPSALRGDRGPQEGEVGRAIDPHARKHQTALSVANHVDLSAKVTAAEADQILARASIIAGTADFPEDVACCASLVRGGAMGSFGTPGDGRDSLDNATELTAVLDLTVARIKVVRVINHCSGPGTNIVGCSYQNGFGMAVVRTGSEGALWLHEYGHNAGLGHLQDSRNVMYPFLVATALGLTQPQCDSLHAPPAGTQANPQDVGVCVSTTACTDADLDGFGRPGSDGCPNGAETDCNDTNANVYPGRRDLCNRVDNDCDGQLDNDAICSTFDVNGDGRVTGPELAWVGRAFGACSASQQWWFKADFDLDGCVDGDDLAILSSAWNCTGSSSVCH